MMREAHLLCGPFFLMSCPGPKAVRHVHHRGPDVLCGCVLSICYIRILYQQRQSPGKQLFAPCKGNTLQHEQALHNLIQPDEKRLFHDVVRRIGFPRSSWLSRQERWALDAGFPLQSLLGRSTDVAFSTSTRSSNKEQDNEGNST